MLVHCGRNGSHDGCESPAGLRIAASTDTVRISLTSARRAGRLRAAPLQGRVTNLVRAGQMSRLGEAERFRSCVWIRGPDRETPVPGGGAEGYLHGGQKAFQSSGTLRAPVPPDFMSQYLRLALVRTSVERELWASLPLITDISRYQFMPKDLINRADELRLEAAGVDDRIVRRRVRDRLNQLKLEQGPDALGYSACSRSPSCTTSCISCSE